MNLLKKLIFLMVIGMSPLHPDVRTGANNPFVDYSRTACFISAKNAMAETLTDELVTAVFSTEDEAESSMLALYLREKCGKGTVEVGNICTELEEGLKNFLAREYLSYSSLIKSVTKEQLKSGEAKPVVLSLGGQDPISKFLAKLATYPEWRARSIETGLLVDLNELMVYKPATSASSSGNVGSSASKPSTRGVRQPGNLNAATSYASAPASAVGRVPVEEAPYTPEELKQHAQPQGRSWFARVKSILPRREALAPICMATAYLLAVGIELCDIGSMSQTLDAKFVASRVLAPSAIVGLCMHAGCEVLDVAVNLAQAAKNKFSCQKRK